MAATPIRILCVHGVGKHPDGGVWQDEWTEAIETACGQIDAARSLRIEFCCYQDLFERHTVSLGDMLEASARLAWNGVTSSFRAARGLDSSLYYTAGMVVKWVESGAFRRQTRRRLISRISDVKPDLILGHSLGSLVCYDTFTHPDTGSAIAKRVFASLGSQINNPFVVAEFRGGRLSELNQARLWYHLYNPEDDIFTAPIHLPGQNFRQVETRFDIAGVADHSAVEYLKHRRTTTTLWHDLLLGTQPSLSRAALTRHPTAKRLAVPRRRALLIGICDYPQPEDRLQGCVNDVYLMSSVLQEIGFDPENIRVVSNERATAAGIRKRIDWLLEDTESGDERVLYYSGHGAKLPQYGLGDRIDRQDEALVPFDFDWSEERAIVDDWLFQRYAQLSYETRLTLILDCCYSGGMAKGTHPRIRGLNPPDDIRHRSLRWDAGHEMWVARDLALDRNRQDKVDKKSMPLRGLSSRLGYAMPLRTLPLARRHQVKRQLGHRGPYLPVIVYACQESEYAYEYEHGSISHGAFTYAFAKNWRKLRRAGKRISVLDLVTATSAELQALQYDQRASVVGPEIRLKERL